MIDPQTLAIVIGVLAFFALPMFLALLWAHGDAQSRERPDPPEIPEEWR